MRIRLAGRMSEQPEAGDIPESRTRGATRWACGVSYDGTGFCGWQVQPPGATPRPALQNVVEAAIARIAGHPVATRCAGRTDAGVHAMQQVVQFDSTAVRPPTAWVRGVNAFLPDSVRLRWAVAVADDFDARFAATARTYWYLLIDEPVRAPLWRDRAGWTHRGVDCDRMREAAACLLGRHDFSSFRGSDCQAATPVRIIESIEVVRDGRFVLLAVTANAFLHHMVRNLVGSLVYVGDGRRPVDWLREVLEARDRSQAAPTFAAAGLYLASVRYDAAWQLPITTPPLRLAELA